MGPMASGVGRGMAGALHLRAQRPAAATEACLCYVSSAPWGKKLERKKCEGSGCVVVRGGWGAAAAGGAAAGGRPRNALHMRLALDPALYVADLRVDFRSQPGA